MALGDNPEGSSRTWRIASMIEDGRHDLAEGVTQHLASIRHASSEARQARCEKANVTPITVHAARRPPHLRHAAR